MKQLAIVVSCLSAAAVAVTPNSGPPVTASQTTINNGPGNQTDPHVSGSLAAYTADTSGGLTQIRYYDFTSGADTAIPNGGALDFLSDIHLARIVFTRVGSGKQAIMLYDVAKGGPAVELDPVPGSKRRAAAIGGGTVAWIDVSTGSSGEVVVHDIASGATAALTSNTAVDRRVAVAPNGDVVVWEQCASVTSTCDVHKAVKGTSGWVVSAVTATAEHESFPDTNGRIVVYGASRPTSFGGSDIYWTDLATGFEAHLALDGPQQNPNISENLIAFEGMPPGATNFDLFVYDVSTNLLYRLTDTPNLSEALNDISVSGKRVRVVWSVVEGSDENVYGMTLEVPERCRGPDSTTNCRHPGNRPLLATLTLNRTTGGPNTASTTFTGSGAGLLCVENNCATAGWIDLNGQNVVGPSSFKRHVKTIQKQVALTGSNTLDARIAGAPGTSYRVKVYGADPEVCTSGQAVEDVDEVPLAQVSPGGKIHTIEGDRLAVGDDGVHALHEGAEGPALGCSSSGAGAMLIALLALAVLVLRPVAPVSVRVRRGR